jgi:DNA-binding winged helix-turn-helix (wHTH) protein
MQARATNRDRRRLGLFEVRSGELFKRGIQVRLQDQPLQILVTLLERPGDIVSREELKQVLWPNGIVVDFDEGLNTAVKKLRSALGDAPENPTFIETVPRRGYRFIAPVTREPSEIPERNVAEIVPSPSGNGNGPGLSARRPYWLFRLLAGVAVLALALTIFGWWRLRASGPSDITERQLTNDSRENPIFQDAISGDGKYLAFAESSGLHLKAASNG